MRVAYYAQVRKYGNSWGIKIPKEVRTVAEIEEGDYVRIEVKKAL